MFRNIPMNMYKHFVRDFEYNSSERYALKSIAASDKHIQQNIVNTSTRVKL